MIAEAFTEKLHEIIEHLMRTGFERPLFFACIAADGCTMTGSYGMDHRVVVTPRPRQSCHCRSMSCSSITAPKPGI
jgi:hypothetical protein